MKIKPKCVNCKRPVGSIFSTKVDDDGRHLIAICGDRTAPCLFNININLGLVENIRDNLNSDEDSLSQNKREIIIDKNDMLFGYITEEEDLPITLQVNKWRHQIMLISRIFT
jgi:hypothetical protein